MPNDPKAPFTQATGYATDEHGQVFLPTGGLLAEAWTPDAAIKFADELNELREQVILWKSEADRLAKAIDRIERIAMDAMCVESHNKPELSDGRTKTNP